MGEIIKPAKLKSGDTVGIISPSSPLSSKRRLVKGMNVLRSLGFKPVLSQSALKAQSPHQAGSLEERLLDFHTMFSDKEIKAIFCVTGGYISLQLLEFIDWNIIRKNPKVFVGYSDITVLLNAIYSKTGLITFHGPMIEWLDRGDTRSGRYIIRNLKNVLMRGVTGKILPFTEWRVMKPGKAVGNLVGGNFNSFESLLGTRYLPKYEGKILFIEEVDETIEGLDNYFWRLRLSGVYEKIQGLIIGKITNIQDFDDEVDGRNRKKIRSGISPTQEEIILQATKGFDFPIMYDVDFGHDVASMTLPVGGRVRMECPGREKVGSFSIVKNYL